MSSDREHRSKRERFPVGHGAVLGRVPDEKGDNAEPHEREAEADDEYCIERPWCQGEQEKGEERTDRGACGVERAMDAEPGRKLLRRCRQGDHRVTRRCPDALSDAVCENHRRKPGKRTSDDEERRPGHRRQRISGGRDLLVVPPAVTQCTGCDPNERRRTVVKAVKSAEGQRTQAQHDDDVERQDQETISEEMSVKKLVNPRRSTVRLTVRCPDNSLPRPSMTARELSAWYTTSFKGSAAGCQGRTETTSSEDMPPVGRRKDVHGLGIRRGVARHRRALVPRAAAAAVRRVWVCAAGTRNPGCRAIPVRPIQTGLEASLRRRQAKQAARRRRLTTRTIPAVALVVGSATMLPIAALRSDGAQNAGPLREDPPSQSFRLNFPLLEVRAPGAPARNTATEAASRKLARSREFGSVEWHQATSVGLPYAGHLAEGTQLPVEGHDWVTWNPITDSVPNLPGRLYGNERTIRTIVSVLAAYRTAHPNAQRVVIGDISLRNGGRMDDHASHQNGLDVDVYYPRLDRHLSAPITTSQIDHALAQDLLDRFVASGADVVFVGYSAGSQWRERGRRPVSEPREPHARPLPDPTRLSAGRRQIVDARPRPAVRPSGGAEASPPAAPPRM